jgi:GntR family galactonate operon transcriptional repressor
MTRAPVRAAADRSAAASPRRLGAPASLPALGVRRAGRPHGYPARGLHGGVLDELGAQLVAGWVMPGGALPTEAELASELQVSRTVIREALRVLAAKGLVDARPMLGTRVRPRDQWHLLDADVLAWRIAAEGEAAVLRELLEIRLLVEPAVAALAARRQLAPEELLAAHDAMVDAADDEERFVEADLRFHAALLAGTGNASLRQLYAAIGAALRLARTVQVRGARGAGRRAAEALPAHRAVLDAIRAGDPAGAEAAMRTVVEGAARDAEAAIAGRAER